MQYQLHTGQQSWEVEIAEHQLVGQMGGSASEPVEDLMGEVLELVSNPQGAAPLRAGFIPGDQVTLVVDRSLPRVGMLVAPVVDELMLAGVAPANITVLGTPDQPSEDWQELMESLPGRYEGIAIQVHDPTDDKKIGYLATTPDGLRAYLNRCVVEADGLVVIGRVEYDPVVGLHGTASHVFPSLSDAPHCQFSRQLALETRRQGQPREQWRQLRPRQQCDHVGWLVGLYYVLAISVDEQQQIDNVWFGERTQVQQQTEEYLSARRSAPMPDEQSDLVVLSVGNTGRSAWLNLASALETAQQVVTDAGAILAVCDIDRPLGPAPEMLEDCETADDVLHTLPQEQAEDLLAATLCEQICESTKVYLLSNLDEDVVDQMGFVQVPGLREFNNLIRHASRCFLIDQANTVRWTKSKEMSVEDSDLTSVS